MNKNTKLVTTIILLILAAVIIFQNTVPVYLNILFWGFEASLIILLLLVFLIGLIIGYFIPKSVQGDNPKRWADHWFTYRHKGNHGLIRAALAGDLRM